jgi:hypothetical protein
MSTRLYDIVEVNRAGQGIQSATELAAVRVGLVNSPDAGAIQRKLRNVRPEVLRDELKKMLDVDLLSLLAGAWSQVRNVRDAARESLKDAPAEHTVELPRHAFEAALKPRLVVSVGGVDWGDVDFELSLSATLTSATLHITAGNLTGVQLGQVTGSVRLSCEGTELREYARELSLLPEYRLDPPIALAAADAAGHAGAEH